MEEKKGGERGGGQRYRKRAKGGFRKRVEKEFECFQEDEREVEKKQKEQRAKTAGKSVSRHTCESEDGEEDLRNQAVGGDMLSSGHFFVKIRWNFLKISLDMRNG